MSDPINVRAQALALFMTIYAVSETGGPVHVQLDDGNLDDECLGYGPWADWNKSDRYYEPYPFEVAQQVTVASVQLLAILKTWTVEEREKFIDYAHSIHAHVAYHWNGSPWTS